VVEPGAARNQLRPGHSRVLVGYEDGNQSGGKAGIDPYRVLGLEKTATDDQVKKRYREMVSNCIPDTAGVQGTEFLFQLVLAAYQQISKRKGVSMMKEGDMELISEIARFEASVDMEKEYHIGWSMAACTGSGRQL